MLERIQLAHQASKIEKQMISTISQVPELINFLTPLTT